MHICILISCLAHFIVLNTNIKHFILINTTKIGHWRTYFPVWRANTKIGNYLHCFKSGRSAGRLRSMMWSTPLKKNTSINGKGLWHATYGKQIRENGLVKAFDVFFSCVLLCRHCKEREGYKPQSTTSSKNLSTFSIHFKTEPSLDRVLFSSFLFFPVQVIIC